MSRTPCVSDDLATLTCFAETVFHTITGRRGYYIGVPFLCGGVACVRNGKANQKTETKRIITMNRVFLEGRTRM